MKKRLAALDIGTARVGIAISDPETGLAMPHSTVHLRNTRDPYAEIARILNDLNITHVVAGWPLELDGSEGPAIRRTKQFLARLKKTMPQIKITAQDERMTSCAAENALQTLETRGSEKKNIVDAMAAALILQMYIDRR